MDGGLLEEFKAYLGLMQFYLNLVLQTATLAMTVTSGVVAYVVKGEGLPRRRGFAMLLPAALCAGLGVGFLHQTSAAVELRDRLVKLAHELKFGLAPHGDILVSSLAGIGSLLLVTSIVLLIVAGVQILRTRSMQIPNKAMEPTR